MITRQERFPASNGNYIVWNGVGKDENNVVTTPAETVTIEIPSRISVTLGLGIDRPTKEIELTGPLLKQINTTGTTHLWLDISGSKEGEFVNLVFTNAPFIDTEGFSSGDTDLIDYYTKTEVDNLIDGEPAEMLEITVPIYPTSQQEPKKPVVLDDDSWDNFVSIANGAYEDGSFPSIKLKKESTFSPDFGPSFGDTVSIVKPQIINGSVVLIDTVTDGEYTLITTVEESTNSAQIAAKTVLMTQQFLRQDSIPLAINIPIFEDEVPQTLELDDESVASLKKIAESILNLEDRLPIVKMSLGFYNSYDEFVKCSECVVEPKTGFDIERETLTVVVEGNLPPYRGICEDNETIFTRIKFDVLEDEELETEVDFYQVVSSIDTSSSELDIDGIFDYIDSVQQYTEEAEEYTYFIDDTVYFNTMDVIYEQLQPSMINTINLYTNAHHVISQTEDGDGFLELILPDPQEEFLEDDYYISDYSKVAENYEKKIIVDFTAAIGYSEGPCAIEGEYTLPDGYDGFNNFIGGEHYQLTFTYNDELEKWILTCPQMEYAKKLVSVAGGKKHVSDVTIDIHEGDFFELCGDITNLVIDNYYFQDNGESVIYVRHTGEGDINFEYPPYLSTIGDTNLLPNKAYLISLQWDVMVIAEVTPPELS